MLNRLGWTSVMQSCCWMPPRITSQHGGAPCDAAHTRSAELLPLVPRTRKVEFMERRTFFAAMALGSLATALVIVSVPYLPTNDGPQHVLSGFLQQVFSQPDAPYSRFLEPLPEFAEHGFSLVFVPLLELFAWRTALQVTLVVIALTGAWAFAGLTCALAKQHSSWALLGFVLAFPWTFYMGFLPFLFAANMGMAIIALLVAREQLLRRDLLMLSSLLLVEAVMHVAVAIMTGAVMLLVLMFRAPVGARLRSFGVAALIGLPAALVLAAVALATAPSDGSEISFFWPPRAQWLVELPRYLFPGSMVRALAGCALVGAGLITGFMRTKRGHATRTETALLVAATFFLIAALLGPLHAPGWQFIGPRFATIGVPLAVALLGPAGAAPSLTAGTRGILAAVVSITTLSLAVTYNLHQRLWRGCEPALAGLSAPVDLAGFTLPLPLDGFCGVSADSTTSDVPHLQPLFHVGALYSVARGGFTPYMFGGTSAINAFRFREEARDYGAPPRPLPSMYAAFSHQQVRIDPEKRKYLSARFCEFGKLYDHILVVGAHEGELEQILGCGYAADWQNGSAMIAHPLHCTIDLLVNADAPPGVRVEFGQRPAGPPAYSMSGDLGSDETNGMRHLRSTAAGCGRLWLRGFLDVDGSGSATKGDVFCAGAGSDGRIDLNVTSNMEVTCRLQLHGQAQ